MGVARSSSPLALFWPGRLAAKALARPSFPSDLGRDLRLDLLRGLCVFAMVADHIGGQSWLAAVTGGNRFFVSAAEGFVLISGMVLGMVTRKRVQRNGISQAMWAALRRAETLYLLSIALTLLFGSYVVVLGLPWGWDIHNTQPLQLLVSILTLHQTFYLIDILVLYTLLLLVAPIIILFLVRGQEKPLLIGSWLLWGAYQVFPQQASLPWEIKGGDTFPFAAWQALFTTGLVIGYHRDALARKARFLPRRICLTILAVLFVGLVLLAIGNDGWLSPIAPGGDVQSFIASSFAKTSLAPGRIVALSIVFPLSYLGATIFWRPVHALAGAFLLSLGQNSLYAYTMHVAVVAVVLSGQLQRIGHSSDNIAANTTLQVAAIALIWLMIRQRLLFRLIPR